MIRFFVVVLMLIMSVVNASANIEATGEGVNRDAALSIAMRRAVEQSLGTFIRSETVVVDSALVDDRILSHSKGYVKSYSVVKEGRTGDSFAITILAVVDSKILKDDIDALTILRKNATVGNPRILVVSNIKDRNIKNKEFNEDIYNGIVESLTDKQFRVVDKSAADQFGMQIAETHGIDADLNKAAAYGLKYQAEYTLYYDVSGLVREGANGKSVQLNIKSQLIDNTRALVITNKKIENSASGQTVEQALEKAGREGGKAIVEPVLDVLRKHWMDVQNNGAMYTIVIDGVDDAAMISKFTEMLDRFPLANGTKEVESGGGKTTFEATYRGKRDQLDRDVLRAAQEIGWTLQKVRAEGGRTTWKKI